jgi:hypothetical protein
MSVRHAEVGSVTRQAGSATAQAGSATTQAGSVTRIENSRNIRDTVAQRIQELISGGTFVNRPRVDIDFSYLAGIPAYLRAKGFRPGAHVVSARMIPADETTASALRIQAGTLVYDVVRIRLADEVRISLENARFPVSLAPDLLSQPLDDSIYDLLISATASPAPRRSSGWSPCWPTTSSPNCSASRWGIR